ncbi:MAG: cyclodeaminase/cyclohydrolase family protein [Eubacterium sp.]|nr:cyclodeaminase/cyclohydrolase family protein [Eubacterium sp.]
MIRSYTIEQFLDELASGSPTPGGGGASALVGAIGTALGHMVGALTTGKEKYAGVNDEIQMLMKNAENLMHNLTECIQKDADAFAPLARCYSLPKDTPGRDQIMEGCLQQAAAVPLRIMELAAQSIEIQREFAIIGNPLVISDAATGVALCRAALMGALVNVKVNTKLMKDRCCAEKLNEEADNLAEQYRKRSEEIFNEILERF